MMSESFCEAVDKRSLKVGVIGLGYVGLPLACTLAETGFSVTGVDWDKGRIASLRQGLCPIEGDEPHLAKWVSKTVNENRFVPSSFYTDLRDCDVAFICVETPISPPPAPPFEALQHALMSLASVMKQGILVIIESTVAPNTILNLVIPLLEAQTGLLVNRGFYLGHCPERLTPGRLLLNLRTMARICGGSSKETAEKMAYLYRSFVTASVEPCDCVTAELVKTGENAFRDVNIAFANELALICEQVGADFWRVRHLINQVPGRNVLMAGAGVGGHCIPKDSLLLAQATKAETPLLTAARRVNDQMPKHMLCLLKKALDEKGIHMHHANILACGYSYIENSADSRHSPTQVFYDLLLKEGIECKIHDPWVKKYKGDLHHLLRHADAVLFFVAHDEYRQLSFETFEVMKTQIVIDGRSLFDFETYVKFSALRQSDGSNTRKVPHFRKIGLGQI